MSDRKNMETVAESVRTLISKTCRIPIEDLDDDKDLLRDLGVDGDDAVELLLKYSTEFEVSMESFTMRRFFSGEGISLLDLWRKRTRLTIRHLIFVASRGKWEDPA